MVYVHRNHSLKNNKKKLKFGQNLNIVSTSSFLPHQTRYTRKYGKFVKSIRIQNHIISLNGTISTHQRIVNVFD